MATVAAVAATGDRLGQVLVQEGLLTREQLAQGLAEAKSSKFRLGYVLVKLGLIQEIEITKVLARQYRMPAVDLSRFEVDARILKLIPPDLATRSIVLPLKREGRRLETRLSGPRLVGPLKVRTSRR